MCTGAEPTHAAPCEAPLLRKFGLSFGCDVSVRSSVQTLGEGEGSSKTTRRGGEFEDNPTGSGECHLSWREISRDVFGQPAFSLAENRMTTVAFEKSFFLEKKKGLLV